MPSLIWTRRRLVATTAVIGAALAVGACGEDELSTEQCSTGLCAPGATGTTAGQVNSTGVGATAGTSAGTSAGTTSGGGLAGPSGLPCDVEPIVHSRCAASCHSDPPIGTFMPLLTHAHFHALSTTQPSRKYYELAGELIHESDRGMPPRTAPQLTESEKATLDAWLQEGAPMSTETCSGGGVVESDGGVVVGTTSGSSGGSGNYDEIDTSGLDCYKLLAHNDGDKSSKFDVGVATDAYFGMVYEAPWQGTVYGLVVKPIIDNASVLHHWLLYREPGAGVDGQVVETGGEHSGGELIAGWAPGGNAMDFRTKGDVAFELPDTTYTMEFHYNSGDASAQDASGVEICVQKEPPEHLASMSWLGFDHGAESYVTGAFLGGWASGSCFSPSDHWEGTCDPGHSEPIHLLFMLPHMHEKGVHMSATINGPNGSRTLHDEPFDFDYQVTYDTDEVLMPGETVTTVCDYSAPACSGQATSAEMCYLFTYAWPAGALADGRSWGATAHGDNTCLGQDFL